jgi:biotin carboxyl carrier protein
MTFELDTRIGRRSIELRRRDSAWEMILDGRILRVAVTAAGGRWSLLIGPPEGGPYAAGPSPYAAGPPDGGPYVDGRPMRSYEVAVERRGNGERIVYVNGVNVPVSIVDPRARLSQRRGAAVSDTGPRSIVSPMPGRIVKVLVREGDTVEAQQGLIVVEAMKMENELRAPRAGQVTAVKVVEGVSVDANAVLVTLA